jgi:hypothetical protein
MTSRKSQNDRASKPWLPDPKDIEEVIEVHTPNDDGFTIERTNIRDPYEEPQPPARPARRRKK